MADDIDRVDELGVLGDAVGVGPAEGRDKKAGAEEATLRKRVSKANWPTNCVGLVSSCMVPVLVW